MDAISLLKKDHREVSALFKKFESATSGKGAIAAEVCKLLTVHAEIEEEIFYPEAREALEGNEEAEKLLDEAEVEHASAKDLIAQIQAIEGEKDDLDAKMTALAEGIEHHVKEEETELFPKLSTTDLDLEELGQELQDRKTELLADTSELDEDEEESTAQSSPAKTKKDTRPSLSKR